MAEYNWDITLKTDKGGEILIDTQARYGYWEWPSGIEGGGLWFDKETGKTLEDSDGYWCLPMQFVRALREAGFILGDEWDI